MSSFIRLFDHGINTINSCVNGLIEADQDSPYATISAVAIKIFSIVSQFSKDRKDLNILIYRDFNSLIFIGSVRLLHAFAGPFSKISQIERMSIPVLLIIGEGALLARKNVFLSDEISCTFKINILAHILRAAIPFVTSSSYLIKATEVFVCATHLFDLANDLRCIYNSDENFEKKTYRCLNLGTRTLTDLKLMRLGFYY